MNALETNKIIFDESQHEMWLKQPHTQMILKLIEDYRNNQLLISMKQSANFNIDDSIIRAMVQLASMTDKVLVILTSGKLTN